MAISAPSSLESAILFDLRSAGLPDTPSRIANLTRHWSVMDELSLRPKEDMGKMEGPLRPLCAYSAPIPNELLINMVPGRKTSNSELRSYRPKSADTDHSENFPESRLQTTSRRVQPGYCWQPEITHKIGRLTAMVSQSIKENGQALLPIKQLIDIELGCYIRIVHIDKSLL